MRLHRLPLPAAGAAGLAAAVLLTAPVHAAGQQAAPPSWARYVVAPSSRVPTLNGGGVVRVDGHVADVTPSGGYLSVPVGAGQHLVTVTPG